MEVGVRSAILVGQFWVFGFQLPSEKCGSEISKKNLKGLLGEFGQKGSLCRSERGVARFTNPGKSCRFELFELVKSKLKCISEF